MSNAEIVRQLLECHVRHDRARAGEILSPRLVWRMVGHPAEMGRDDYLAGLESGAKAFSDVSLAIHDVISEGEKVAVRSTWRMRHTGPFLDLAPTGREVEFAALWMYRVVDGRVVEIWSFDEDFTGRLRA